MWGTERSERNHALAQMQPVEKTLAVVELDLRGTIIRASQNFLETAGYSLEEIRGKHHSILVSTSDRKSPAYGKLWEHLRKGESHSGQFQRLKKDGSTSASEATYTPIIDKRGQPVSIIETVNANGSDKAKASEDAGKVAAIERTQAVIEFTLDGTIVAANKNFLDVMGYSIDEIQGRHHSMFVEPVTAGSPAYKEFWATLGRGQHLAAEYKRMAKGGREVWIIASYNPIFDDAGVPCKVVKFATNVTNQKQVAADTNGQIEAIRKSQAVIEFNMDGTIRWANDNFLQAMGYSLTEVKGKHHRMFVDATERGSAAYEDFWNKLNRGEYQAAEYRRLAKGGREIWIQASYNPILDLNGKPFKVVKYATDVSAQAQARMKADRARGLIESVAAGSEEMNASIRQISETMLKSRQTTIDAVGQVETADRQAERLNAAAEAMSGITDMIGNITSQINLLALNATIESARAGEAGKGFAVVASEVKGLANQAKQATVKIAGEIEALTCVSRDVVSALAAIRSAISHVSEYVASTAAAVEEQSAVTNDIASNMQRAAAELA